MSARAGIVVTGTEVLTGRVSDRNGPWLAERLRELGVDLAHTTIVGDRPEDMEAALRFMAGQGLDLIVTSGGLGPTADDLTAEVVGRFQGREMALDEALSGRIAEIVRPLMKRWPNIDPEAIAAANRKQATVPEGATVLEPVGTAPGLVVPPPKPGEGPTVVVLPGPPRELQPMWGHAVETGALQAALAGATVYRQGTLRLFGMPESEIAETLRVAGREGIDLGALEVTTCLKRGEVEVVTRYEPAAQDAYDALAELVRARHADTLFSDDGRTVDEILAGLLRERELTIATAESCTGGLLAARLTELPGSSDYVRGAIVAYANEAKVSQAGVPRELIDAHGAVSGEVAEALADGARERLDADLGVGITGVAGPGGGSAEKPVGLVWLSVAVGGPGPLTRSVHLPGGRADVRDRATTVAMHLVRRALLAP
ncbi:MAG TPA: competence/damage-inducible protein A [Solirubrobacteraceae bacterium]|nr:competence/damage-inducible protein A [Solirubrobacteraceae bacterium]HYM67721.1 competence/damage-inducible protein A [Patescibacteria group bacterium]